MNEPITDAARAHVRSSFRWLDGEADMWSMLTDGASLHAIVAGLSSMAASDRPDRIVGIESRGFVLGPAVALQLGVGFVAVRKDGAVFPGPVARRRTGPDYRGKQRTLSIRRDHVSPGARLVFVDDWVETGSQAMAVSQMVEELGAEVVSLVTMIDETTDVARRQLPPVRSLLRAADLPGDEPPMR
ncbi:phosphoribosyltransferase [Plantibacter sp. VKM Ac-2880]|uniref:phosphoribosyltransferase family protein n=1 Tax=Plantibacter sp. VKM Ac-2880 TaxID=2783827 RepID=UPI00188E8F1F|nr:phosphoribosyltransferase family protein [Plantibacter sp. VKM Ac-2880]MBF4567578.1 phosphoribosyltransferase [Plantibacter sp. VKM Ac-2880]